MKQFIVTMVVVVAILAGTVSSFRGKAKLVEIRSETIVVYKSTTFGDLEEKTYYEIPIDDIIHFDNKDSSIVYIRGNAKRLNRETIFH